MAKIVPLDVAGDKLGRHAGAAAQDYVAASMAAAAEWAAAARAAGPNYAAGIQLAIQEKRYEAGIAASGPEVYAAGVKAKGSTRYGPGVTEGVPKWIQNFAPFHSAIASATPPPRRPRRDPGNLERVSFFNTLMVRVARGS